MEGPQHGRGSQETEGEEETGPQITSSLSQLLSIAMMFTSTGK